MQAKEAKDMIKREIDLSKKLIKISVILLIIAFILCVGLDYIYMGEWNIRRYIWMPILSLVLGLVDKSE